MMHTQIIERFKHFQKETNKYSDLDITLVEFERVNFNNAHVFKFIKGLNKYVREYIDNNPGEIPVLGSSLENQCISGKIIPISESDIIDKECVSFNKDNAKGSRAFYRNYPFVMDRHHLAIIPNLELINVKFLSIFLDYFLQSKKYGWGTNVASVDEVMQYAISIPKQLNETYNSLYIQESLVSFFEYFSSINQVNIDKIEFILGCVEKLEKLLIPHLHSKQKSVCKQFNLFCKNTSMQLELENIEFEDILLDNYVNFVGGSSDYSKSYFNNAENKGDFDVFTGSLDCIAGIKPLRESDIIKEESVSFNKDNDAGSKAFYHNIPYIVGGHHYAILIKNDFKTSIHNKYFYFAMKSLFDQNMFFQSKEPRANSGVIKLYKIKIPKSIDHVTSIKIQEQISLFFDQYFNRLQKMKLLSSKLKELYFMHSQFIIQNTFNN